MSHNVAGHCYRRRSECPATALRTSLRLGGDIRELELIKTLLVIIKMSNWGENSCLWVFYLFYLARRPWVWRMATLGRCWAMRWTPGSPSYLVSPPAPAEDEANSRDRDRRCWEIRWQRRFRNQCCSMVSRSTSISRLGCWWCTSVRLLYLSAPPCPSANRRSSP